MKTDSNAVNVLRLFATYGFRKASMSDIACAANLSRQSIYNQFGSKEAVLKWAVTEFLNEMTNSAISQLEVKDEEPARALARAYQVWAGDHVPLLRGTPHGAEILDTAINEAAEATRNFEGEFTRAVTRFLLQRGVFQTEHEAGETTFVLNLASKGLILKCDTSEAYAIGMERSIAVLLNIQTDDR